MGGDHLQNRGSRKRLAKTQNSVEYYITELHSKIKLILNKLIDKYAKRLLLKENESPEIYILTCLLNKNGNNTILIRNKDSFKVKSRRTRPDQIHMKLV